MSFQLGEIVPLSVSVTDSSGNPANAGSVALTVTLPDGTTDITTGITPTATGVYDHDYQTVQAGRHGVRWVATGVNAAAFTDAFTVEAADDQSFVSLREVKKHMKKDLAKTTDDGELGEFITAACSAIEERIGNVSPRTVTEEVRTRWGTDTIVLDQRPVVGVTSVVLAGTPVVTIPPADADTGVEGWRLRPGGVVAHSCHFPQGTIRVAYTTGRTPVPGNIRLAAIELTAFLWRSIKVNNAGSRNATAAGADEVMVRGVAFALPNRVKELLGLGRLPTDDVLVG